MLAAPHLPERFLPMAGFALQHTEVVLCPRSMIGRVIGKNGETIKALQARACSLGLAYLLGALLAAGLLDGAVFRT